MSVIYVSDFDLRGSGYMNIAVALCSQLAEQGVDVIALGMGYGGQEHRYPFKIVPARLSDIVHMVSYLMASSVEVDAVVVALDIPLQAKLVVPLKEKLKVPYVGLFPLESGPLCVPWAMLMLGMDERLVMSHHALKAMAGQGVDGTFIPIGVDCKSWRSPSPEERAEIRQGMGVDDDTFVVLTVADNQERKNLSRALEMFADFAQDRKALYYMVTRPRSPVGWELEDYAARLGIFDRIALWERGLPFKSLWSLFAAADAFLLTSKAEGLAMPILEAMAAQVPAVGTNCTAIKEHLDGGRGLLINHDYQVIDPWGNSLRYFASRENGARQLRRLAEMPGGDRQAMLDKAQIYACGRTWEKATEVLSAAIDRASQKAEKK